ncbi:tetratricopeptide repeat protein [Aquimarina sp. RZ0]|uniref:tetratricopeptide repeat-containing sensor histidine kinase n=1 Tax=Aquimarina sp. RZ0 TaxID=2607730 RepID=UPI00165EE19C|nr:tetratricopeptide repeat protein [Aquimarina sp. RZ0]
MSISLCIGQEVSIRMNNAIDSMTSNPDYTYKILTSIANNNKNPDSIIARARLNLGNYFNTIGVVDSSMYYTRAALIHLRSKRHMAKAYRTLGSCFRRSGQMDNAIEILYKGLKISEEIGYKEMISIIKSDLGILYINKKEYDKAIQFLQESIESAENQQAVYGNYSNIGTLYFFKGDLDNAEKYFIKALELVPDEKDPKTSATLTLNIGSILFEKKEYKKAGLYFDKSKEIADRYGFKDKSLTAITNKAEVIDKFGDTQKAIAMLSASLVLAKEISNLKIQKDIYENLTNYYTKINKHQSANKALTQFHILKDSMTNARQKKEVTELEVKYETAQKEKEILLLKEDQLVKENEIKRQHLLKKSFVIGFISILIPIIGLLLVYYQKLQVKIKYNAQKEEMDNQKFTSFLKEQELKLANMYVIAQNEERSRIARELHDSIGGNLAAVRLQLLSQKDKKQDTIIEQLNDTYEQVREISHDLIPKKISQTAFTSYINDYLKTLEKSTEPDITFIPHPIEDINTINDHQKVEIFKIIQELMTNTLKHAKAKVIEICLNVYNDSIEILFEDDGIGFDKKKENSGIGLQNIQKRLALLEANMDIDSAINRGTAIRIKIPMTPNDKASQI